MSRNIQIVSFIKAGNHIEEARQIAADMYSKVTGGYHPGYLPHELFPDGFNRTGEGEPLYYCCFPKVSQYQFDKWNELIEEHGLKKINGNYTFIKIDTVEAFLNRMNLKRIEK